MLRTGGSQSRDAGSSFQLSEARPAHQHAHQHLSPPPGLLSLPRVLNHEQKARKQKDRNIQREGKNQRQWSKRTVGKNVQISKLKSPELGRTQRWSTTPQVKGNLCRTLFLKVLPRKQIRPFIRYTAFFFPPSLACGYTENRFHY